jgi:hypothetical protein
METASFRCDFESNSKLAVFWEMTSCGLVEFTNASEDFITIVVIRTDNEGSRFFWNNGPLLPGYTVLHSRKLETDLRSRPLETQISLLLVSFLATSGTTNANKEIIIFWHWMTWRWEERHRRFGKLLYLLQNVSSFTYHNTRTCHKRVMLTLLAVRTINFITKNKKILHFFSESCFWFIRA